MISIVIASVKSDLLESVRRNISDTIGVDFEVISFDNSNGAMSLCEIYNQGAEKANYKIVCYMHEDIEFKTTNWGQIVLQLFNANEKLGIVGVAGSSYKPLTPSSWGSDSSKGLTTFSNYSQSNKKSNQNIEYFINNPGVGQLAKVVCVDGLWFCTKKAIALEKRFDEDVLKGFHCYDIDYCLNVGQDYDVCVTFDVFINHFSEGSYDENWLADTLKIHEKWKTILPKSLTHIGMDYQRNLEKMAFKKYILAMFKYNVLLKDVLKKIGEYKNANFMNYQLYLKLKFYALTYYVKSFRKS